MSTPDIQKQLEEFNYILREYVKSRMNLDQNENIAPSSTETSDTTKKTAETQTDILLGNTTNILNDGTTLQYHNFIRLNLLFPDLHPATLHGALGLCKNDLILTVDSLLYARNLKKNLKRTSSQRLINSEVTNSK